MVEDSYWNLLNSYGWEVTKMINGGYGPANWTNGEIDYDINSAPFYFNRTGDYLKESGSDRSGRMANLWSKVPVLVQYSDRPAIPSVIYLGIFEDTAPSRVDINRLSGATPLRCLTQ